MDQQILPAEAPPDAAASAFNELRQEVAYLRRGLEKFTDEHPRLEIIDYTETLGEIREYTHSLATSYKKLRETPVLQTTPEQIGKQIAAAGAEARRNEQAALNTATSENATLSRELSRYLQQAQTAHRQNQWVFGMFAFGFVLGCLIVGFAWLFVTNTEKARPLEAVEQHQPKATKHR